MPKAVISRQFFEVQPKNPDEVRQIWIFVHIFCLCVTACSGWLAAYTFGTYLESFDFHCTLFAKLFVVTETSPRTQNLTIFSEVSLWDEVLRRAEGEEIDIKKSKWGEPKLCHFVQFLHVGSMLSSIIWIVFFAISGSGSRLSGSQIIGKPYRLVLPFLGWCIISIILLFAGNSTLTSGLLGFCSEFQRPDGKHDTQMCFGKYIETYKIFFGNQEGKKLFTLFVVTKFAGYIDIVAWLVNALWTCLRIYLIIDYKFFLVTVWRYEPTIDKPKKSVSFLEPEKG